VLVFVGETALEMLKKVSSTLYTFLLKKIFSKIKDKFGDMVLDMLQISHGTFEDMFMWLYVILI